MTSPPSIRHRLRAATAFAAIVLLAACAGGWPGEDAVAGPNDPAWPPPWQDQTAPSPADEVVRFEPPSAPHCRRVPAMREVPGWRAAAWPGAATTVPAPPPVAAARDAPAATAVPSGRESVTAAPAAKGNAAGAAAAEVSRPRAADAPMAPAPGDAAADAARTSSAEVATQAQPSMRRPAPPPQARVTAGMVDDNADFGEYLAYRDRHLALVEAGRVRDRDVGERYLLEVTDAAGRPVHDAEVAVQRTGRAEPLAWARTDTAGRAWLHPRAWAAAAAWGPSPAAWRDARQRPWPGDADRALGIAVRKGAVQGRAVLARGQANAVQVRLAEAMPAVSRPRLDLVFLIDATGSMGDEIAKLKASMRAVAAQIDALPVHPDVCYGLVAYRDRGDAFLTRTQDFTHDLGAFQFALGRLQATGGGDKPEALNEALHEAVHGLAWRAEAARIVVLLGDAAPHLDYGGPQYDVDMQAALAKGIKLFAVGASGLDTEGEYVFRQLAQYTAGRFVFLTYRDAANPASGAGTETVHDVRNYSVQTLDRLIVRLVGDELARLARS